MCSWETSEFNVVDVDSLARRLGCAYRGRTFSGAREHFWLDALPAATNGWHMGTSGSWSQVRDKHWTMAASLRAAVNLKKIHRPVGFEPPFPLLQYATVQQTDKISHWQIYVLVYSLLQWLQQPRHVSLWAKIIKYLCNCIVWLIVNVIRWRDNIP